VNYKTVHIKSDVMLEAWHVSITPSKGTVILFHGYSGEKSSLITRAEEFSRLGYSTLLVDFMGSGGSEGEGTTIGYAEAREVRDCYEFVAATGEKTIHLFGTSMGAAAILKSLDDYVMHPASIILECPFGSLYKTICARFELMGVPSFPMAGVLTFWGGFQQGYWTFGHNPSEYASSVDCPALLLFGELDDRVSMEETQEIYANMKGKKVLVTYPDAGHNIFTPENAQNWVQDVSAFMSEIPGRNLELGMSN
jgi:alpha-beta hydrolase superfamily lysophospholipase